MLIDQLSKPLGFGVISTKSLSQDIQHFVQAIAVVDFVDSHNFLPHFFFFIIAQLALFVKPFMGNLLDRIKKIFLNKNSPKCINIQNSARPHLWTSRRKK
jgi:hypothetical protein